MTSRVAPTAKPVAEYHGVTRENFERDIKPLGQPAILRGLASGFPLVQYADDPSGLLDEIKLASNSVEAMTFRAPIETGGRYFYDDDIKGFNFNRLNMSLAALCDILAEAPDDHIYAGGVNIPKHCPDLQAAHKPELIRDDTQVLTSLWLGNSGRVPAHWDLPQNIAVVIHGQREFTLFPTEQMGNLYVGPIDNTLAGQPCSLVDFHAPDFEAFPKFKDAMPQAQFARLAPGDAIYIPSLWFHHVENPSGLGCLMNFWWRDGPEYMFTPNLTLMHALLTLRELPEDERARWKVMFDEYIFGGDTENKLSHIPKDSRGILGDMTPERVRQIKQYLGQQLLR